MNSVLLVGAGGAGAAVGYAAMQLGVQELQIYDRDASRAEMLADRLGGQFGQQQIEVAVDLCEASAAVDGLIHATPMGMKHHPGMAIPAEALRPEMWVADIVYFPLETELLRQARLRGCRVLDGGGMAVFQAARAFHLFTGREPDAERMLAGFRARALS